MNIICYLFGHKPETYGSQGQIRRPYHDGIGRAHRDIYAECERCNRQFHVISVIDPLMDEHRTEVYGMERVGFRFRVIPEDMRERAWNSSLGVVAKWTEDPTPKDCPTLQYQSLYVRKETP